METDLSLNEHHLRGSVHYLHGFLNTKNKKNNQLYFILNGSSQVLHDKTQVGLNWKYPISELIKLRFTR